MPRSRPFAKVPRPARRPGRLSPFTPSGANPGALAAHIYVPDRRGERPPLVVVLHGCTQDAGGYDHGAGWSTLADRHGFVLLFPEQSRTNNANLCFNWFEPGDIARGQGEVASIAQMIEEVAAAHGVDRSRIFVTGLSAGGAMTAAMLAAYPELFAAGAIIAGLPYGCAGSVPEALERMRSGPGATGPALAQRMRAASRHGGPWPRLSVWHGDADRTVSLVNAEAIVDQWVALHGLPAVPSRRDEVAGHPRRVWIGADGTELIEDHMIAGMGHGTPLSPGDGEDRCGVAGAYMLDVGISSSHAIARFWGILDGAPASRADAAPEPAAARERAEPPKQPAEPAPAAAAERLPARAPAADPPPRRLEVIGRSRPVGGVQGIIEGALRSAGLMK